MDDYDNTEEEDDNDNGVSVAALRWVIAITGINELFVLESAIAIPGIGD